MGGGEGLGPFQNIYIHFSSLKRECWKEVRLHLWIRAVPSSFASASWRSGATWSSNFWNGYAFVPQKKKCYICIYHHLVYFTLLSTREKSICWRSAQGSMRESSNCSLFSEHGEIIWTRDKAKSPRVKLFGTMARTSLFRCRLSSEAILNSEGITSPNTWRGDGTSGRESK